MRQACRLAIRIRAVVNCAAYHSYRTKISNVAYTYAVSQAMPETSPALLLAAVLPRTVLVYEQVC